MRLKMSFATQKRQTSESLTVSRQGVAKRDACATGAALVDGCLYAL